MGVLRKRLTHWNELNGPALDLGDATLNPRSPGFLNFGIVIEARKQSPGKRSAFAKRKLQRLRLQLFQLGFRSLAPFQFRFEFYRTAFVEESGTRGTFT